MVLTKKFEEVLDSAFHFGGRGIAIKVLGTTPPVDIMENLQCLYRKLIYQDIDTALFRLNYPMNRI